MTRQRGHLPDPVKTAVKSFLVLVLFFLYVFVSLGIAVLPRGPAGRRSLRVRTTSRFARLGLRVLGVRVDVRRVRRKRPQGIRWNYLVLANHLSYIDILIVASLLPGAFITSVELRSTFPLGLLARFGGSLFVERRSPAGLKREIAEAAAVLKQGIPVILFPEGTTSNGETVRPFKNSLLTAAIQTGTPLLPVCIRYTRINGRRTDASNRDAVLYHGGATFLRHLPKLLSLDRIDAECAILRPVAVRTRSSRKELAAQAHGMVRAAYHARRHAGAAGDHGPGKREGSGGDGRK